jgi:hypothetical protein
MITRHGKPLTWDEIKKRKEAKAAYDKERRARKKAKKASQTAPKQAQNEPKLTKKAPKNGIPAQDQAPAKNDAQVPFKPVEYPRVTRAELMKEAQERGIKYFRILKREELQTVLDPNTEPAVTQDTIEKAKLRWKAGWGTRKSSK